MKLTKEQMAKVESVLSQMTLEEKIGQMNQESPSIVGGFDVPFSELIEMLTDGRLPQEEFERLMSTAKQDFHEEEIRAGLVGSVMGNDPRKANELQKIAVEETRLGIPLIIGFDVIHGLRSVFPIAIAEAGSFDDGLFEETAHMAAKESRAHGISWNFAAGLVLYWITMNFVQGLQQWWMYRGENKNESQKPSNKEKDNGKGKKKGK